MLLTNPINWGRLSSPQPVWAANSVVALAAAKQSNGIVMAYWTPATTLRAVLTRTYAWIELEISKASNQNAAAGDL